MSQPFAVVAGRQQLEWNMCSFVAGKTDACEDTKRSIFGVSLCAKINKPITKPYTSTRSSPGALLDFCFSSPHRSCVLLEDSKNENKIHIGHERVYFLETTLITRGRHVLHGTSRSSAKSMMIITTTACTEF